jgi:RNA polymerase sigma-70 factor (ECF subfamily)
MDMNKPVVFPRRESAVRSVVPAAASPYEEAVVPEDFVGAVEQYQAALLRYTTRVLNNADAAQDVVQETFIRLHENWCKVMARGVPLKGWLFRTAHNASIDYIRKESRLRLLHERQSKQEERSVGGDDSRREQEERHALVMQHLGALRPREREVLVLRMQEEMSYKEIAAVIKRSEGYVGSLIHSATKKLTRSLRQAGVVS